MKKQVLFSLCLTACSAVVLTGCATKQEAAASQAQQEAIEVNRQEAEQVEAEVSAEPTVTPNEAEVAPGTVEAETKPAAQPETKPEAKPETKPAAVHPQPVSYTVTAGDSVSALATRFKVRQPDILALNPSLRGNPNNLRIGQKVLLPAGTDVTVKAKPRAAKSAPAAGSTTYTVKSGDVLGTVARKHGVKVEAIKKANNLKGDTIWVGQKLTIPGATKKPAAKPAEKKPAAKPVEQKPVEQKPVVEQPAPVVEEQTVIVTPVDAQQGEEALPPPPVAPVEEAAPQPPVLQQQPAAPAEEFTTYVVGEKEDLVSISLKFNVLLTDLRAANNLEDTTNNAVAPGTTLRIPKH
ncbi:MAG: LysM peptidoglycan-binding domain-containing protein [Candidatus Spyradenecus sp.]